MPSLVVWLALIASVWDQTLFWTAYPLRFPPFSIWPALCLAALAIPVLVPPLPLPPVDTSSDRSAEAEVSRRSALASLR